MPPIILDGKETEITKDNVGVIFENIKEAEKAIILKNLNSKQENKPISAQKESIEKTPKLEKENFRIDADLSKEEKIAKGWKETIDSNGVKALENAKRDVWEYLEGDNEGEQFFTKASAIREADKAGKRLPASWKVFRDIIKKQYEGDYQAFLKGENIKFCGWRYPNHKGFYTIDKAFDFWCEDGSNFHGINIYWTHHSYNGSYGFSVRCLQD